jgi:iron(III) transport system permease protein
VGALTLVPVGYIVASAVAIGPGEALDLIVRPRVAELLWNTVRLVVVSCALSALLGTAAAWVVECTDLPAAWLWRALLAAPLAVPAFVHSYSWVSLTPAVQGFGGATLVVTLAYLPYVELPVAAALRGLDATGIEAARSLGLSRTDVLRRVVLPAVRPAMLGGVVLVALHLLAEFGAIQLLRFPTFTTAIFDLYQASAGRSAAMLAGVLTLLCLVVLVIEVWSSGAARRDRVGRGAARPLAPVRLGGGKVPAIVGLLALAAASVALPVVTLVRWLVDGASSSIDLSEVTGAVLSTLRVGLLAALLTSVAALAPAWLAVRHRSAATTAVERGTYLAHALPGIVVALALVTVAVKVPSIYQSTPVLLVAYVVLFLPLALVAQRASMLQLPPIHDEVARSLGCRPFGVARRVVLPAIAPGVVSGAALVFLAVSTELTATLLLAPTGTETLATRFWANADALAYGAAAPYAALMVLLSVPATILLARRTRS